MLIAKYLLGHKQNPSHWKCDDPLKPHEAPRHNNHLSYLHSDSVITPKIARPPEPPDCIHPTCMVTA